MRNLLLVFLLFFITTTGVLAQGVTTASISGVVTDQKGDGLPGANIVATHTPSGTEYGTSSSVDGRFTIPNARVGGPYTIRVSFVGFQDQVKEGLQLSLGTTTNIDFKLVEAGTELEEVVVSGSQLINSDRTGAITTISNSQINDLPTINRSFGDYVRLTPQAVGNNFGGRSDGYNNITIDGALFNNAFGLSGTVGGQANAQPISLDAVDQIAVSIAPYDVTQGSFTGAGVNVVTRSGSNDVTGSVYYFTRNEKFVGTRISGTKTDYADFKFNNMGFRVGGPIVKNKVFFFANFERERQTTPGTTFLATRNGSSGSNISQVQATDLDALSSFLIENYDYNPGPYEGYDLEQNNDKGTFKIDWNISKQHKLSVKYNYLDSYRDVPPSSSGSFTGGRSPSQTGLPFLGAYYRINNNLNSVIAELNSIFGNKYANKFQVGYSAFRDFRETPTSSITFPLVDIGNGTSTTSPTGNLTAFGYEPFSAYNLLNTNVFQISDNFEFFLNKHVVTVGTYNEFYQFENGFDPFFYGGYQFNSLDDFYASAAGTIGKVKQYQLGYAANETGEFPLVKVKAYQLGFYAQDKYEFSSRFNATVGLRVDIPTINTDIARNEVAAGYTFAGNRTIETDQVPKSSALFSPRVGFNWDVNGDKTTQVRGGTGIFTGRVPFVWISNQASNNGMLFGSQFYSTANATAAGIVFSPDVNAYRPTGPDAVAPANNPSPSVTYNLAVTDDNFKFPQVWRTNVAVDQKLPWDVIASIDLAFTKDINAVYHQNINLPDAPRTSSGSDNRPIYYPAVPSGTSNSTANTRMNAKVTDAILMSNTSKGYSYFATLQLNKSFASGMTAMAAYTYTDAKSVNDGGSIAQSIWRDRPVSGSPNANTLGYFNNLSRHRIIASVNYKKEYLGFLATTVGFFYSLSQSAGPTALTQRFSYVYQGDMNGDNAGGNNDLIYIPKTQSDIKLVDIKNSDGTLYTADEQWSDLNTYIDQDKYLSEHRGEYAQRNGSAYPWTGQLDLRILQDFYIKTGKKKNTFQLSFDVFNLGNLINSDWGVYKSTNRNNLLAFQGYDAEGVPQFQYNYLDAKAKTPLRSTFRDFQGLSSRWQMQFGIRYIFN